MLSRVVVPGAVIALLLAAVPAGAQTLLTPDGPATLRDRWLGFQTTEGRAPEVIIRWSLTVVPGGRAGRVRLRVLRPGDRATLVGSSPWVRLPAEPGTYVFRLRPGIRYDYRDSGLAIEQETGGHAILRAYPPQPELGEHSDPFQLHALDVFQPVLTDAARDIERSSRVQGQGLRVNQFSEYDVDEDGLGDTSQDLGDLRILRAAITSRKPDRMVITARARNVGRTVRHLPHVVVPAGSTGWGCVPRPTRKPRSGLDFTSTLCAGPALSPGREATLRLEVFPGLSGLPRRVSVASEGTDTHPGNNSTLLRGVGPKPGP